MSTLTLRQRLTLAFAGLTLIVLICAGLGLVITQRSSSAFNHFAQVITREDALVSELNDAVNARALAARNLVLVTSDGERQKELAAVLASHGVIQQRLQQLQDHVKQQPSSRPLLQAVQAVESRYGPVALSIVDKTKRGEREAAVAEMNELCRPLLAELLARTADYLNHNARLAQQAETETVTGADTARTLLWSVLGLAVLVASALAVWLPRSVMRALGSDPMQLSSTVSRIAGGDLGPSADAVQAPAGSVMAALEEMRLRLASIVAQVRSSSDGIATASSQIAQGNQDLSTRTEQQASSLQQSASSMEELGTTVKLNAENAQQANQLAQGASRVALRGGEVVGQVVETMRGINESSRRISDIIGTIDGIAFQTNILALNAAVEAARAGEQGRGFAVVASEVRSLAQRSADAAREIKALIAASVERVDQGTVLVDSAGATMTEIVQSIRRVSDIVGEISSASVEQSQGVTLVGNSVSQMDRATQQNAALVEESAAAAESLRQQAQQLVQAVSAFRLSSQTPAIGADTAPTAQNRSSLHRPQPASPRQAPQQAAARPASEAGPAGRPGQHAPSPAAATANAAPAAASARVDDDEWAAF